MTSRRIRGKRSRTVLVNAFPNDPVPPVIKTDFPFSMSFISYSRSTAFWQQKSDCTEPGSTHQLNRAQGHSVTEARQMLNLFMRQRTGFAPMRDAADHSPARCQCGDKRHALAAYN